MPLRPLPFLDIKRRLEAAGFIDISTKGSHVKFIQTDERGTRVVIVPRHREVTVGTLRSILRQAGLSVEEFEQLA